MKKLAESLIIWQHYPRDARCRRLDKKSAEMEAVKEEGTGGGIRLLHFLQGMVVVGDGREEEEEEEERDCHGDGWKSDLSFISISHTCSPPPLSLSYISSSVSVLSHLLSFLLSFPLMVLPEGDFNLRTPFDH